MKSLIKKRQGQQEIIVTVLLILIAIAAVAFVATFIMNQIKDRTAKADDQLKCIGIDIKVTKAINNTGVITVQRNDNEDLTGAILKVIVDGTTWNSSAFIPKSLETELVYGNAADQNLGKKIQLGVVLDGGTACPIAEEFTVTAA